ncbi:hypothetical protein [Symmachiella dynata]|uniref:hypothetical protein n=1 Tax=Symmachiella dynata TaxID=2527995 RepID=UPI0030EDF94F
MATPKTFKRLGKMLIFAGVLAFLAGPAVTTVGMTNTFEQISQTDEIPDVAVEQAVEKTVSLSWRTNAIGIPVGLTCLVAGICCYVVAARLKRLAVAQNGEIPAA